MLLRMRTFFHLAPFITRITSISINCGLPPFSSRPSSPWLGPLFCLPCPLKAFAVRQVFNTFPGICFERLFAKWAPHHSPFLLDSISVHGLVPDSPRPPRWEFFVCHTVIHYSKKQFSTLIDGCMQKNSNREE